MSNPQGSKYVLKRKKIRYYKNIETQITTTTAWYCFTLLNTMYLYAKNLPVQTSDMIYGAEGIGVPASSADLIAVNPVYSVDANGGFNLGEGGYYWTRYADGDLIDTLTETVNEVVPGSPEDYDFTKSVTTVQILKRVKYGVLPGAVRFESMSAGVYSLNLQAGNYEVILVGAGGGGSQASKHSTGASGGSGAAFKGVVALNGGAYNITVGVAGAGSASGGNRDGASSMLNDLIIAGGGGAGVLDSHGGAGGVLTLNTETVVTDLAENGNAGVGYYGGGSTTGAASLYNGYGAGGGGGWTVNGAGSAGLPGYVKIIRIEKEGIVQTPYELRRK